MLRVPVSCWALPCPLCPLSAMLCLLCRSTTCLYAFRSDTQENAQREQTSNWEQRPLTFRQLAYAALDAIALVMIHERALKTSS